MIGLKVSAVERQHYGLESRWSPSSSSCCDMVNFTPGSSEKFLIFSVLFQGVDKVEFRVYSAPPFLSGVSSFRSECAEAV